MHILVSGAEGFTGRHFVRAAEAYGNTVWRLRADLSDRDAVMAEVAQAEPDAVVHLGAISFVGNTTPILFYDVNVVGTVNLLNALISAGSPVRKVLIASSANVYGNCGLTPITESQAPAPVNHYAASKLAMEYLALSYSERLPILITRPFNYTGPGQSLNFVVPKLVERYATKMSRVGLGNIKVHREFNDVRMVCEAYCRLLEIGRPNQLYNVCTGRTYALEDVLALLAQLSGHKVEVEIIPALVRQQEIHRLCGSPNKLIAEVGDLPEFELRDTLKWMLTASSAVEDI